MPRNRMIKHDFWADEKTGQLSIGARLMFVGTWNFADDIGVFRGNFAYLKANIFPYDEKITIKDIKIFCNELVKNGLVIEGKFNDETYFLIKNFSKHQKVNRPSDFRFVQNTDKHNVLELFNSVSTHYILSDDSLTKEKEKEKEKDKDKASKDDSIIKIVDYLNNATGKNYKASTDKTKKLITSLLKRDYTFENFTHVIDVKCQEWGKDEKMKNYLRPETLFGSKFESYLNQEKKITEEDVLRMLEEL